MISKGAIPGGPKSPANLFKIGERKAERMPI